MKNLEDSRLTSFIIFLLERKLKQSFLEEKINRNSPVYNYQNL